MITKKDKKAEAAETLTWVVVTVIIIVILALSIYAADLLGNGKRVQRFGKDIGEGLITISTDAKNRDLLSAKSLGAFLLTDVNGIKAYDRLKTLENLDESTGPIARNIFCFIYKNECKETFLFKKSFFWLGFYFPEKFIGEVPSNDYFGSFPTTRRGGDVDIVKDAMAQDEIFYLNQDKNVVARTIYAGN